MRYVNVYQLFLENILYFNTFNFLMELFGVNIVCRSCENILSGYPYDYNSCWNRWETSIYFRADLDKATFIPRSAVP